MWRFLVKSQRRATVWTSTLGLCLLVLTALLAGCGAGTTGSTTGGSSSPGATATPPATSVKPCPGGLASTSSDGTPALTLTENTPNQTGSAHVGDLIQVQLPATMRWSAPDAVNGLSPTQHAGDNDQAHNVCFWNFHATAVGTSKLAFNGTALCQNGVPCPAFARHAEFTVRVG